MTDYWFAVAVAVAVAAPAAVVVGAAVADRQLLVSPVALLLGIDCFVRSDVAVAAVGGVRTRGLHSSSIH